jgi:hypothetical protein
LMYDWAHGKFKLNAHHRANLSFTDQDAINKGAT